VRALPTVLLAGLLLVLGGCLPPPGPPAPDISIEPASPDTDDDLLLVLPDLGADPEALGLSWQIGWSRDGEDVATLAGAATVPAAETSPGETWQATVSLVDDDEVGPPGTASVTIAGGDDDDVADDDDSGSDDDDSGSDDDDVIDDDDAGPPLEGPASSGLCAGAGRSSNADWVVLSCTGPVELAPGVSTNGIHTVVAGSLRLLPAQE
jgi:hypothetical protein